MKYLISPLIIFLLIASPLFGQTDSVTVKIDTSVCGSPALVFAFAEEMPSPAIGWDAWPGYLQQNILYPDSCIANGQEGTVYVSFVVEASGRLYGVRTIKGVPGAPALDAEAVRVVQASGPWIPGKVNGRAVCTRMNIPIKFKLK